MFAKPATAFDLSEHFAFRDLCVDITNDCVSDGDTYMSDVAIDSAVEREVWQDVAVLAHATASSVDPQRTACREKHAERPVCEELAARAGAFRRNM